MIEVYQSLLTLYDLFSMIVSILHRIFGPIGRDPVELGRCEIRDVNEGMDQCQRKK